MTATATASSPPIYCVVRSSFGPTDYNTPPSPAHVALGPKRAFRSISLYFVANPLYFLGAPFLSHQPSPTPLGAIVQPAFRQPSTPPFVVPSHLLECGTYCTSYNMVIKPDIVHIILLYSSCVGMFASLLSGLEVAFFSSTCIIHTPHKPECGACILKYSTGHIYTSTIYV